MDVLLEGQKWVVAVALMAFIAVVGALMALVLRHGRRRKRLVDELQQTPDEACEPPVRWERSSLDGIPLSPIDRVFPRHPRPFLLLVAGLAGGVWLAGLLLAPDRRSFLVSREWYVQPFYIVAHLVTLRMFINGFTRNFAAGVAHLDMSVSAAVKGVRLILGLPGAIAAAVVAAPFCFFDWRYLHSPTYERVGTDGPLGGIDYLMFSVWTLEWFVNAFIWVLLIGFMVKNCVTIWGHPFRAPIDEVLHGKQYRPFLTMSSQGAGVVLGFGCMTVLYIWLTSGALTDYLGLAITVALVLVGFVPPWLILRSKVDHAVQEEKTKLRADLSPGGALARTDAGGRQRSVEERLDEALALLRITHLEAIYGSLGQTEAKAILLRLMAPAATIAWQVSQNLSELGHRFERVIEALLGRG